jgi:two-component system CheB/CheR fusion protein
VGGLRRREARDAALRAGVGAGARSDAGGAALLGAVPLKDDEPDTTTLERQLRLLVEQTQEHAIVLLDTEGRIQWCNAGAERIFGIARDEIVGRPLSSLFTPEEAARGLPENELAIAEKDIGAEDDRWLVRGDGSRFWATGAAVALRDAEGRLLGFGKILRNRTDLREQMETLRNQLDASEAASHRKDLFLATLSHELRNPLASLGNAVQLIRMSEASAPDMEVPLRIIERQVASLRRLVDDLLDLSRIGAGKLELETRAVALHEVLQRAVESVEPLLVERRHRCEVLLPSAPMLVDADAARLEQVFVNLLHNAAKYTPEGGRIWIKGTTEGDEAVVQVKDTGVGIPHEMLPRIFDLFTQVESSRSHSEGGLGIGLSLVKNLVALHGGTVQVRSDGQGAGSEFTVRLPLKRAVDVVDR